MRSDIKMNDDLFRAHFLKTHHDKLVCIQDGKLTQVTDPANNNLLVILYNDLGCMLYDAKNKLFITDLSQDGSITYSESPTIFSVCRKAASRFQIQSLEKFLSSRVASEQWTVKWSNNYARWEEFSLVDATEAQFITPTINKDDIALISTAMLNKFSSLDARLNMLEKKIESLSSAPQKESKRLFKYLNQPDYKSALVDFYFRRTGKILDFNNLQTFNEKTQAYKLYGDHSRMGPLSDKYVVRDYIRSKGYWHILLRDYGAYTSPEQIDYDLLPEKFAIKCNHGSGMNRFLTKGKFDKNQLAATLNKWLLTNYAFNFGFELQYKDIKPLIMVEEFIPTPNLTEYKFWCFKGEAKYVNATTERAQGTTKITFFDLDWVKQDFTYHFPSSNKPIPRPYDFDKMLAIAQDLADDFPHVRVDLYNPEPGVIYFGELTFSSNSGCCEWTRPSIDKELGTYFDIEGLLPKS